MTSQGNSPAQHDAPPAKPAAARAADTGCASVPATAARAAVRPSVRPSVRWSVHPSVHMSAPGRRRRPALAWAIAALFGTAWLAACGGGDGSNADPIDNPPDIVNQQFAQGRRLSFVYYQRCVNPILVNALNTRINGATTVSTCASGGCHDDVNGTGGALRLVQAAPVVNMAPTPPPVAEIRASAMYRNFYSAQAASVPGDADASRLLNKPLVNRVLHGGGVIFTDVTDANVRVLRRWISRPMPDGEDEFSAAAASLFTPPDATTGACIEP